MVLGRTNSLLQESQAWRSKLRHYKEITGLVLALEDEIGKRGERAGIFRVAMAIEARLGPLGIVLREAARAAACAGVVHQGNNSIGAHRIKFHFGKKPSDKFSCIAMAIFHRVNKRERDFAFLQIAQYRLSELLRRCSKVQQIIPQLERQAGVSSVFGQGLFFVVLQPPQYCAQTGASAEQAGRLKVAKRKAAPSVQAMRPDFSNLINFTFN